MERIAIDPQRRSYAQGAFVANATSWLYVSGQVPAEADGSVPPDFEAQCRLAWRNVARVLAEGGMTERNLVKVTIFLADRQYREANARIRHEILGDHHPALTIIITEIFEPEWLLEIEAVAAA